MLQTLRENMIVKKVVLWLVVLGLVLGLGIGVTAVYDTLMEGEDGSATGPWALHIGGETITPIAFQNEIRNVAREMSAGGQAEMPEFQQRVQYEAMSRIVRRTLGRQQAREAGLSVSDEEVSAWITSLPELQRGGRFVGTQEYKALLARNDLDVVGFENSIRDTLLIGKWETLVGNSVVVTDGEVDEEFARRNEKVRFDYVKAEISKIAPASTPTDAQIQAHYDTHPDRYQRGEARRCRYVLIDERGVEAQVPRPDEPEIRGRYDADRTRYPGEYAAERQAALDELLFQRSQSEIERRAAALRAEATSPAALEAEASKEGWTLQDSGPVRRDADGIARLGPDFVEALFRTANDAVGGPVRTLRGTAVFALLEVTPPRRATIAEAREEIAGDLTKEKSREAAIAAARAAAGQASGDLSATARALGASVESVPLTGRGQPLGPLGYAPAVETAAFGAEPGTTPDPVVEGGDSIVVLKVLERSRPDPGRLASERESIRSELRRGREYLLVNSILDAAMKKTELKSNEEYFKQLGS